MKLLISDIDDTLLRSNDPLEDLDEFITTLGSHGYTIVLATARPMSSISKQIWARKLLGLIPYNGLCFKNFKTIELENCKYLNQIVAGLEGFNRLSLSPEEIFYTSSVDQKNLLLRSDPSRTVLLDDSASKLGISMLSLCHNEADHPILNGFDQKAVKVLKYKETRFPGGWAWTEIIPCNVHKGAQVEYLLKKLRPEVSLALGNGWNDLEMLTSVDRAYCPDDSDPVICEAGFKRLSKKAGKPFRDAVLKELLH